MKKLFDRLTFGKPGAQAPAPDDERFFVTQFMERPALPALPGGTSGAASAWALRARQLQAEPLLPSRDWSVCSASGAAITFSRH